MDYLIPVLSGAVFVGIFTFLFSFFNMKSETKRAIVLILGISCAFVFNKYYSYSKKMEVFDATTDLQLSNFKLEKSYKVFSPPYLREEGVDPQLDQFVVLFSVDITNKSGASIINYEGIGPDKKSANGGNVYVNFLLNNFNDMGESKELIGSRIFLYDGKKSFGEFSDENPFQNGQTLKAYGYLDLMGRSYSSETNFIDYFTKKNKFTPELTIKIMGGTPEERTKYWFKKIEPAVDVSTITDFINKTYNDSTTLSLVWKKTQPYNLSALTTNPWKDKMKTNEETKLTDPSFVLKKIFELE